MEGSETTKALLALIILLLGVIIWFGYRVVGQVDSIRKELNDIGIRYTYMVEEIKKTAEWMLRTDNKIGSHGDSIVRHSTKLEQIERKVNNGGSKHGAA